MRILSIAIFLAVLAQAGLACDNDATPVFACQAANDRKFIELCAASPVAAEGYLQYRFGALDRAGHELRVELEYPERRAGSLKHFYGATYTHLGSYTQSVRFTSGMFAYTVFTRVHGTQDQGAGVAVRNLNTGRTTHIYCNERPRFYIYELQGLLACDPQTPIGKACIK